MCLQTDQNKWRVISFAAAVLLMDDDILVSAQDVQFAFRVWKVGTLTHQQCYLTV